MARRCEHVRNACVGSGPSIAGPKRVPIEIERLATDRFSFEFELKRWIIGSGEVILRVIADGHDNLLIFVDVERSIGPSPKRPLDLIHHVSELWMSVRGHVPTLVIRSVVHQPDTSICTANAILCVLRHVARAISWKHSKRFHFYSSSNQELKLIVPTNTGCQQSSDRGRILEGILVSTSPPGVTTMRTGP